jgi:hypothetical protein
MAKNQTPPDDSTENAVDGQPVTDVAVPDEMDEEVRAAVQRAANFVVQRGYGPNTTRLIQYIAGRSVDEADLNAVITEQLTERLLNATTAEDILTPFDPEKGEAYFDRPIIVHGMTFIESDYEGFPWYVSLEFTLPGQDKKSVLTVGGEKVIMQAAAAEANGLLPLYCRIHKATKATKQGYYPLDLRPMTDVG